MINAILLDLTSSSTDKTLPGERDNESIQILTQDFLELCVIT